MGLNKFDCCICKEDFIKEDNLEFDLNEILIFNKAFKTKDQLTFGHLHVPTDELTAVVSLILLVFEKYFHKLQHLPYLKANLFKKCINEIQNVYPQWLKNGSSCENHREFLINKLLTVKIQKHLLWQSREFRKPRAAHRKLLNVQGV